MSARAKREYVAAIYERYRRAGRVEKGHILSECCAVTGYHRKAAIRLLNHPAPGAARPARQRPVRYAASTIEALRAIWTAAGYPWSVRLKALLPLWLPWARRRLRLRPRHGAAVAEHLRPARSTGAWQPYRRELVKRMYGRTKPGTLLKHHIPLRTDRWDVTTPGFTEIDLVAHCGTSGDGEFVHSLNLTDIHTTWVETARRARPRARSAVQAALEELRQALPFRLRGIDSDNGSRVHQPASVGLLQAQADSVHAGPAVQEGRQRAHRAEELDARAQAAGLCALRHARGAGRDAGALSPRAAAVSEPVSAVGETAAQRAGRGARAPALRCAADAAGTGAGRSRGGPGPGGGAVRRSADRLDPFVLARTIDQKLERIYALASRHHRPDSGTNAAPSAPNAAAAAASA